MIVYGLQCRVCGGCHDGIPACELDKTVAILRPGEIPQGRDRAEPHPAIGCFVHWRVSGWPEVPRQTPCAQPPESQKSGWTCSICGSPDTSADDGGAQAYSIRCQIRGVKCSGNGSQGHQDGTRHVLISFFLAGDHTEESLHRKLEIARSGSVCSTRSSVSARCCAA